MVKTNPQTMSKDLKGHPAADVVNMHSSTTLCSLHKEKLYRTVKFGGGSIMLWGFVASGGTGNLVKVEGHMDSTQYWHILENNVQESVAKLKLCQGWIFQQDNDPKHCSTWAVMQRKK